MELLVRRIIWFVVLCLVQVLVLNHVHVFHYATPLLFIYFIMKFPIGYERWALLLWGFFMGLIIDIFTNIPGVTAASLTIISFVQPYLLQLFIPKDDYATMQPSMKTLGFEVFFKYALTVVLLFSILFYTFETFNLFSFGDWLLRVVCSTIITLIFVLIVEKFNKHD